MSSRGSMRKMQKEITQTVVLAQLFSFINLNAPIILITNYWSLDTNKTSYTYSIS